MSDAHESAEPQLPHERAKPYRAPILRVYGSVEALTKSVGNTGTVADGGHGSKSKTS